MGHDEPINEAVGIAYQGSPEETAEFLRGYGEALNGETGQEPEETALQMAYRLGRTKGDREANPGKYQAGIWKRGDDGIERVY